MIATPGGESIIVLGTSGQTGVTYLYDALADNYVASRTLFTAPIQSYFGPLAAGPSGSYLLANGLILNSALTIIGGSERPSTVTTGTDQRNVAALAPLDENRFLRFTTTVRNAVTVTATRDDIRPTIEMVDLGTGARSLVGVAAENPVLSAFGTTRLNIPPRQMAVDSKGIVYLITLSGLSVIPTTQSGTSTRPQIAAARGVINATDGSTTVRPGSFISVNGANLASAGVADDLPLPTVLGGSCVVFNDMPLPLLQTGSGRITAQIPETMRPGTNIVYVRSLSTAQSSDPVIVTVQRLQ
jgi:hypothetical protein